jgi:hypothetical protein
MFEPVERNVREGAVGSAMGGAGDGRFGRLEPCVRGGVVQPAPRTLGYSSPNTPGLPAPEQGTRPHGTRQAAARNGGWRAASGSRSHGSGEPLVPQDDPFGLLPFPNKCLKHITYKAL